ncbi:MAG: tetratricopeptide repeat protein [Magnetococcales bacterium]|nr:tetratricopeptide repeat protein [Magnetococcales bacterium]
MTTNLRRLERQAAQARREGSRASAKIQEATRAYGERRFEPAWRLCQEALKFEPGHPEALHLGGLSLLAMGRAEEALRRLEEAVNRETNRADFHNSHGAALRALGRLAPAEMAFRQALKLVPTYAEACHNLGEIRLARNDSEGAEFWLRKALELKPNLLHPRLNLGALLIARGRAAEAVGWLQSACRQDERQPAIWNNLGRALELSGRVEEGLNAYRRAIELAPDFAEAWFNLGRRARLVGNREEALSCLRRAAELRPLWGDTLLELGNLLRELGEYEEAAETGVALLQAHPDHPGALFNLAMIRLLQGRVSEAETLFTRLVRLDPQNREYLNAMAHCTRSLGRPREAVEWYRQLLAVHPDWAEAHSNLLLCMHYLPETTPEELLAESRRYATMHCPRPVAAHFTNIPDPARVLTIGYLSADFREHAVSRFAEAPLLGHDRESFRVVLFSDTRRPDAVTERFRGLVDGFHATRDLSDADLCALIRREQVDILVELSGHTAGNRLRMLALRPAPLVVTWLGYPGTTGLTVVDWRITDAVADPVGTEGFASERLLRLPEGFHCFVPPPGAPEVVSDRGTSRPVFGSFNHPSKLGNEVLAAWGAILQALPEAELLLKCDALGDLAFQNGLREKFRAMGVDSGRLRLVGRIDGVADHLALYNEMDVALDAFPYNGVTTTAEGLWMGVPLVSLMGDRCSARMGASLLRQVGLEDLVAPSVEEYIVKAVALVQDRPRLKLLRETLRERMRASALGDVQRFTRTLETAYRDIWWQWCRGKENSRAD